MADTLHLIPAPRSVRFEAGALAFPSELHVVLQDHPATRDLFAAESFALDVEALTGSELHIAAGDGVNAAAEIRVRFDERVGAGAAEGVRDQAYRLTIMPGGITIEARAAAGSFYAFQTLLQVIRESTGKINRQESRSKEHGHKTRKSKAAPGKVGLPCLVIEDYPDFARRGFYHDTARGKVPTVDTLLQLIDDLGHLKYNEFQLYVENNFQFRKFPEMYDDTSPLTAEEILLLDAACKARHIDFVPSLTSLGHFEKILGRPRFRHLAEAEPAELKARNLTCWVDAPWSLCVTDPAAKELLKDMYGEFAPNFSSKVFNICCDESYDLGAIRSKAAAEAAGGTGGLYVEWIRYCNELAAAHGKRIQMWGDIILNHPELIEKLPADATLLEWGYEADHKFDEHCATFAQRLGTRAEAGGSALKEADAGRKFYVSPGTSTWLALAGRSQNALDNIHNAARAGLKHGAEGLLLTDWGDNGHQQMLALSLLPLGYAAAASWNLEATPAASAGSAKKRTALLQGISIHLFQDATGEMAQLAYDLGMTYLRFSWQRFNASLEFYLFREYFDFANYVNRAAPKDLPKVIGALEKLIPQFQRSALGHPDAEQIRREFVFTCEEVIHTRKRTALRQQWLAADPKKRNPEEPSLRENAPRALAKTFAREMAALGGEIKQLEKRFVALWMARNKKSRLEDVTKEFQRMAGEYKRFAK